MESSFDSLAKSPSLSNASRTGELAVTFISLPVLWRISTKSQFKTLCIAGAKTEALLKRGKDNCTSSGALSPSGSSASIPSNCSTPTRDLLAAGNISPKQTPARSSSPSPRRHPPGFPPNPRFDALSAGRDYAKPFPCDYSTIIEEKIDPYSVNIYVLSENFNETDLKPTHRAEVDALK